MSAYAALEADLLPVMRRRNWLPRKLEDERRLLRMCMQVEKFALLPEGDQWDNRHAIRDVRDRWAAEVGERYGFLWSFLLSMLIKLAIDLLIEWWFRGDKRPMVAAAVKELRGQ